MSVFSPFGRIIERIITFINISEWFRLWTLTRQSFYLSTLIAYFFRLYQIKAVNLSTKSDALDGEAPSIESTIIYPVVAV